MATLLTTEPMSESPLAPREIEVPASTAWPFVLAFGFTLFAAGLVTTMAVSVLGAVLVLAGCIGWFREVLPYEHEEVVPVLPEDVRITTERSMVERLLIPAYQRAWLPIHTYPISAGVKGGLAGAVAMAISGLCLRRAQGRKYLVPHQSSRRSSVRRIAQARPCTAVFISC